MSAKSLIVEQMQQAGERLGSPFQLSERQIEQFELYLELLQRWNQKMDLVSPAPREILIERHFVDSAVAAHLGFSKMKLGTGDSLLDVGSGAGFPGVPIAILKPSLGVVLCEPREKRTFFLKEVVRTLELGNARVCRSRVEELERPAEGYSVLTARALGMRKAFFSQAQRLGARYVLELRGAKEAEKGPEEGICRLLEEKSYSLPNAAIEHVLKAWEIL